MLKLAKGKLSKASKEAFAVLKEKGAMTLEEIKEHLPDLNVAHLTALKNRAVVEAEQVVVEKPRIVKVKVNRYSVADGAELPDEE